MKHKETAMFSSEKIMKICEENGQDYETYREESEMLDVRIGHFNRWRALVQGIDGYDFIDQFGQTHFVPAELVEE